MGKGIVLLWRKVGGENIPRLTGQNRLPEPEQHGGACPGGRQPVPAGVLLCCAPAPEPSGNRQGSIREGAFCPMPCIRGLAQGLLVPLTGSMDRKAPFYTGNFSVGVCPAPRARPPGHFYRERDSPAWFSTGFCPHPALARRDIFTGRRDSFRRFSRGLLPLLPRPLPAGIFSPREGQPCLTQLPVNQPL